MRWWWSAVRVAVGRTEHAETSSLACYVVPTHVSSVRTTSVTAHCHAEPALLTREYQGDHRPHVRTPAPTRAAAPPLDNSFHISMLLKKVCFSSEKIFLH